MTLQNINYRQIQDLPAPGTTTDLILAFDKTTGAVSARQLTSADLSTPAVGQANLSLGTVDASTVTILIDSGTSVTIPAATSGLAGLLKAAQVVQLDQATADIATLTANGVVLLASIADNAVAIGVGGATDLGTFTGTTLSDNLSVKDALQEVEAALEAATSGVTNLAETVSATDVIVTSSTGTDATIPGATPLLAGVQSAADKTKQDFITITQAVDLDVLEAAVDALIAATTASLAPDRPVFTVPAEAQCHIVVDAQTFSITFQNGLLGSDVNPGNTWSGLGLGTLTTGDLTTLSGTTGNPVGSSRAEINLVAQALNMAVASKSYDGSGHAAALGNVIVGVKGGNGGSLRISTSNETSSPGVRVSGNSSIVWDNSRNSAPYADPLAGDTVASYGLDLTVVALDAAAQISYDGQGPQESEIYDATTNPTGRKEATRSVRSYDIKLRQRQGVNVAYYSMIGHISGDFYAAGCEFLPLDPAADGLSYAEVNNAGVITRYDAKSAFQLNHDVKGDTVLVHNGVSGDFPSTAMQSVQPLAQPIVVFQEHNYYPKGGGNVWIEDHGQTRGPEIWPTRTLKIAETNRTFFQVRPAAGENGTLGRDGSIVIRNNKSNEHGVNIMDSVGGHPLDGGSVMTVWANINGTTWFLNNTVTDAYYSALAVSDQQVVRNINNSDGYPIDTVFVGGNTLSSYLSAVGTTRPTAIFTGCQYLHFLSGNSIAEGLSLNQAVTINDQQSTFVTGIAKDIQAVVQHPSVDPVADFTSMKTWDSVGGTILSVDLTDPVQQIPEWVVSSVAGGTDIRVTPTPTGVSVSSSTGTGDTLGVVTGTNAGLVLPAQRQELLDMRTLTGRSTGTSDRGVFPGTTIRDNATDQEALTDLEAGVETDLVGATALLPGVAGRVPAPAAGDEAKVLQGDGTWVTPTAGSGSLILSGAPAAGFDSAVGRRYIVRDGDNSVLDLPPLSSVTGGDQIIIDVRRTTYSSITIRPTTGDVLDTLVDVAWEQAITIGTITITAGASEWYVDIQRSVKPVLSATQVGGYNLFLLPNLGGQVRFPVPGGVTSGTVHLGPFLSNQRRAQPGEFFEVALSHHPMPGVMPITMDPLVQFDDNGGFDAFIRPGEIVRFTATGNLNEYHVDRFLSSDMTAATGSTSGSSGLVPAPASAENLKFLRGDATWVHLAGVSYNFVEGAPANATANTRYFVTGASTMTLPQISSGSLGDVIELLWDSDTTDLHTLNAFSGDTFDDSNSNSPVFQRKGPKGLMRVTSTSTGWHSEYYTDGVGYVRHTVNGGFTTDESDVYVRHVWDSITTQFGAGVTADRTSLPGTRAYPIGGWTEYGVDKDSPFGLVVGVDATDSVLGGGTIRNVAPGETIRLTLVALGVWDVTRFGTDEPAFTGIINSSYTAKVGDIVLGDPSGASFAVTLPANPVKGDKVTVTDGSGVASPTNKITISPGAELLNSTPSTVAIDAPAGVITFHYTGLASIGWVIAST